MQLPKGYSRDIIAQNLKEGKERVRKKSNAWKKNWIKKFGMACILWLAASGIPGQVQAAEEEPLVFAIWDDEQTYVENVVDAYNALKGKEEIRLEVVPNDEHSTWMKNYSDEYGVDIIGLRGNSSLLSLKKQGKLMGLRSYLRESDLDMTAYGTMINEVSFEGEYYALPTRSTCWALYYNKELFDQAGISYPGYQTWEEYLELAERMTAVEKEGQWGGYIPPWIYEILALQQGYYLLDDDLEPVRESLDFFNRAYHSSSHMPYQYMKERENVHRYDFEEGKFAMMVNGEWLVNMLLEDAAQGKEVVQWGIAPLPVPEGVDPNVSVGMYQFAGITSVCRDPEEAFEFLEFLCGPQGAGIYARNGIIPAYSTSEIREIYKETAGTDQVSVFFDSRTIQEQPMWEGYDQILDIFKEDAGELMEGTYTLDQMMELFVQQREEILG